MERLRAVGAGGESGGLPESAARSVPRREFSLDDGVYGQRLELFSPANADGRH
jgi:hypothetical protein